MNTKLLLSAALVIAIIVSSFAVYLFLAAQDTRIRVACVGDSLTQSTSYPYTLWNLLGNQTCDLYNFGAGATTVNLASDTPYANTTVYQDALDYNADIIIIMLGTNDAQPSLVPYNDSFVADYKVIIQSFQASPETPDIYVVLPPPIYDSQGGKMNPEFFAQTLIPYIEQAADETGVPIIDVYSQMVGHPEYSTDGVHLTYEGGEVVADIIYSSIFSTPP